MKALLASINCQKTEIGKNLEIHDQLIANAAEVNCDIVVFPEMSLTGYIDPAIHPEFELSLDSSQVSRLVELTESYSVDALFGIVEHNPNGEPFISQIHARNGMIAGTYRKRNLANDEDSFSPGTEHYVGNSIAVRSASLCVPIMRYQPNLLPHRTWRFNSISPISTRPVWTSQDRRCFVAEWVRLVANVLHRKSRSAGERAWDIYRGLHASRVNLRRGISGLVGCLDPMAR